MDVANAGDSLPLSDNPSPQPPDTSVAPADRTSPDDTSTSASFLSRCVNCPPLHGFHESLVNDPRRGNCFLYMLNTLAGIAFGHGISVAIFLYLPLQMYLKTLWPLSTMTSEPATVETYSHFYTSLIFCFVAGGAFVVNLGFGPLVNVIGRKYCVLIVSLLGFVSTVGACASVAYPMFLIFMFGYGGAVGGVSYILPLYIGECTPVAHEAMVGVMFQVGTGCGMVMNNIINIVIEDLPFEWNWRLGLGVQFIFCLMWVVVFFLMPESGMWKNRSDLRSQKIARYLGTEGTEEESERMLSLTQSLSEGVVRSDDGDGMDSAHQVDVVAEEVVSQSESEKVAADVGTCSEGCRELWCTGGYVRNLWIGIVLTLGMKLTGIDIIGSCTPVLFVEADFTLRSSNLFSLLFAVIAVCTSVLPLLLIKRVGRKVLILFGVSVQTISSIIVGVVFHFVSEEAKAVKAAVGIIFFIVYIFGFNVGLGPTYFQTINVMQFPPSVRAHVLGFFGFLFYFLQCVVFAAFTPLGEHLQTVSYGFYFFAFCGIVVFAVLLFLMPWKPLPVTPVVPKRKDVIEEKELSASSPAGVGIIMAEDGNSDEM